MYEYGNTKDQQAAARAASSEFAALVTEMVEFRKKQPTADLVTELALVEEAGEKLTLKELIATCVLLLNAGHEASVNGFGNGFVAAMQHPDAVAKLRSNPREIATTAVEEFLRFDSPLQLFERTATAETKIGGITVEVGQKIAALLGSANRDESVFRNATELDLTRDPNPQIGFGGGIHFCLGAPLARLEMAASLPALFEAFPKLELAGNPVMRPTFVLRGYESIAVTA
jgi:cytochrome P450